MSTAAADRAVWLAERRNGVGASDVAGILGLSPWASPYSIWASKVFDTSDDDDRDTFAMSFGRRAESMIAPWFHELTGLHVYSQQSSCNHPINEWQRCTIDGAVYETDDAREFGNALGVYEAKTTSATPAEWETDGIPVYYQCQAQWTMHVTGTDRCWFAVLHLAFGRPDLRVYELARDQADIDLIVKTVDAFWHDHVLTGIPPDTDAHQATTYATKHLPASVGDMVEVDDLVEQKLSSLALLKSDRKVLDEQIEMRENAVRAALGECTEGYHNGQLIVSHREQKRTGIDTKALAARLPRVAARFATESTYRVLRAHKPKGE